MDVSRVRDERRDRVSVVVFVPGDPQPKGSKSAIVRHGRAVVLEGKSSASRKRYADWRQAIVDRCGDLGCHDGPTFVSLGFVFSRPLAHFGTGRNRSVMKPSAPTFHMNKPDVDKLARAVLDALVAGGALTDDKNVVNLQATKRWAHGREPAGVAVAILDV